MLRDSIFEKIEEINLCINNNSSYTFGLMSGNSGLTIFYYYFSVLFQNKKNDDFCFRLIEKEIEAINKGYLYHTYSSGLGGFAWAIEHLATNNFLNRNDIKFINDIDNYIFKMMMNDLKSSNYDFLHGAIGNGIYFLNHLSNPKSKEYLIQLIDELDKLSIKETDNSLKWESTVLDENENEKKVFNLSLSHGMASIISFLSKAYTNNIHKEKVKFLLEGAIKYFRKYKFDTKIYKSNFPSWICINEELTDSRLAWCYGDLGIAIAIYQAGIALNKQDLVNISIKVLLHASNRRNLSKENVIDAGLCHGTAGIAHIYNRIYRNTGIEKFKETSYFWIEETLKMAKFDNGLAGYKAWHGKKYGGWKNEYGLLEGIAGIGLALISAVSDIDPKWDECLLLS